MKTRSLLFVFLVLVLLSAGTASAAIPTDYQYYFDFEEGTGTAANNANVSNPDMDLYGVSADTWSINGAIYFNGSSGVYGRLPSSSDGNFATNALTLAANVTPTTDSSTFFISKENAYQLRMSSGKMIFNVWNQESFTRYELASPGTYSLNENYVVVGVFDGSNMYLYVDGVEVANRTFTGTMRSDALNAMAFGSWQPDNLPLPVVLYDAWIYDYAVSDVSVFGGTPSEIVDNPYISFDSVNNAIWISGADADVNLTDIKNDPDTTDYVRVEGTTWYFDKRIFVQNGAHLRIDDNVTEMRIDINTSTSQPMSFETGTTASFKDNLIISGWNATSEQYRIGEGYSTVSPFSIHGLSSVDNITFQHLGFVRILSVPDNTVYSNFTYTDQSSTANSLGIYGSTGSFGAVDTYASNVTVSDFVSSNRGLKIHAIDGLTVIRPDAIYNASVTSQTTVLSLDECHNFTVSDIDSHANTGVLMQGCSNGYLENITNEGIWTGGASTGGRGIYIIDNGRTNTGNNNITVDAFHFTKSGYAGITVNGVKDTNITYRNGYMHTGYHNAIDIRGDSTTLENIYVANYTDSNGQSMAVANSSYHYLENLTFDGKGLRWGTGSDNVINGLVFQNITGTDGGNVDRILGIDNLHDNSSIIGLGFESKLVDIANVIQFFNAGEYPGSYPYMGVTNFSIIDSDLTAFGTTGNNIQIYTGQNIKLVNTKASVGYYGTPDYSTNWLYWYPNIRVLNTTGSPVQNAVITVNTPAVNGWGQEQATFYTDSNGRLYDSGNRSNWLAVPELYRDASGIIESYTSTITATKDGLSDTAVYTASSADYSSDVSSLSGTLTTLTLDVEGSGEAPLAISDFTPTDTTPSITLGDSLNFTVTTSKTADIQWFSNGDLKVTTNDKTSSYYDKTPSSSGEYNITAIADDGVDTVSQTWTLTVTEAAGGSDETTSNQNADIWIKNISILSIVTLIMIIAIPLTAMMAIRRDGELPEGSMNKITVAMIMLMILAVIITLGTAVMEHISGAFT